MARAGVVARGGERPGRQVGSRALDARGLPGRALAREAWALAAKYGEAD